jgi:hypothetical protein
MLKKFHIEGEENLAEILPLLGKYPGDDRLKPPQPF